MLRLDAVLFEQVLFNLLDNAAKYSPPGSRIDVRASRDGELVEIEVVDEGRGFRRTTSSGSSTNSIGSRRRIAAAPAPGSGSRSAAVLSRRWAAGSSPATAATARVRCLRSACRSCPSQTTAPPGAGAWQTCRLSHPSAHGLEGRLAGASTPLPKSLAVLVVDDEPPIRRLLRTTLTAEGCRVVEADNRGVGVAAARAEKPDPVSSTSACPIKSGLDLISGDPQDLAGADHRAVGTP